MGAKKVKTVYLVRHGQSDDNALPVFQSLNSPLSLKGKLQAETIANRLKNHTIDVIISSPLPRAQQTAEYISKSVDKAVTYSDLFVERIKPSKLEGKPWKDKVANDLWRNWERTLYASGIRVEDGENYDDTILRVDNAIKYLTQLEEESIVIVSHGHFIRTLVARILLGEKLTGDILKHFQERTFMENTGITILLYKDGFEEDFDWRLLTLNDDTHFTIQSNKEITG
jgi:broad specificity phosphatase PhoE